MIIGILKEKPYERRVVMQPATVGALIKKNVQVLGKRLTTFSMDILPRTTKAQSMDILSSMATAAGYKAVLDAAMHLPTFFPMFMTAAGTIAPHKFPVGKHLS